MKLLETRMTYVQSSRSAANTLRFAQVYAVFSVQEGIIERLEMPCK